MAKRRARKATRLDAVAIAAGSTLGSIANQLDALNRSRNEISEQIRGLVRRAESELKGLANGQTVRGGRSAKRIAKARRRMSAEARQAISDAQKKRWAAKKGGKAKKSVQK